MRGMAIGIFQSETEMFEAVVRAAELNAEQQDTLRQIMQCNL